MAENVVRQDIVQILFDVDNDPLFQIEKGFKEFYSSMKSVFSSSDDGFGKLENIIDSTSDDMKKLTSITEDFSGIGIDGMTADFKNIEDGIIDVEKGASKLTDELDKLSDVKIDDVTDGMDKEMKKAAKETNGLFKKLRQVCDLKMDKLSNSFKSVENGFSSFKTNISKGFANAKSKAYDFFEALKKESSESENALDGISAGFDKIKGAIAAAGIGLGAGAIIGNVNDTASAINSFAAKTGLGADENSMYADMIKNLYANGMGESMDDVSQALAFVEQNMHNMAGLSLNDLESVTNSALLLRDTFDFDVNESARSAAMLMNQFGITGDEAFNLIAQGAQNGLDKNGDLLDSVNEYGVHFKQLGFSAEDMFNILLNGAQSGTFSVDKLGDAMKEFGIRAIDGSDTTAEAFQAIGLNADTMAEKFKAGGETGKEAFNETIEALKNMEDPLAQNAAGVNLFGTMWEDLGAEGVLALGDICNEIDITDNALERINDIKYDDAGSALASLGRTINIELADKMTGAVNKAKDAINDFKGGITGETGATETTFGALGAKVVEVGNTIMNVLGFIKDNISWIAPVVMTVVGAFLVLKTTLLIVNTVSAIYNTILSISTAYSALKSGATLAEAAAATTAAGAQAGLNAALLACPITWIIVAIVALIAVIAVLIVNWDKIKPVIISVWEKLKEIWGKAAEWFNSNVVQPVIGFFSGLWDKIVNIFNSIKNSIVSIISGIKNVITSIFNGIINFFKFAAKLFYTINIKPYIMIFNYIKPLLTALWNFIKTILNYAFQIIAAILLGIWNKVTEIFTNVYNFVLSIWNSVAAFISEALAKIWNIVTSVLTTVWNFISSIFINIYNFISDIWNNIIDFISEILGNILSFITSILTSVWNFIISIFTNIFNTIDEKMQSIFNTISDIWNDIVNTITGFLNDIWTNITNKFTEIVDWIKGLKDKFIEAGEDIMNGLINGITSKLTELTSKVREVGDRVLGGIREFFDINSPSKEMFKLGNFIGQGLNYGIEDTKKDLENTAFKIARSVESNITPFNSGSFGVSKGDIDIPIVRTPENTMPVSKNVSSENNNFSPQFVFNINGDTSDKNIESKLKRLVKESIKEVFESMERKNPSIREV